MSNVEFAPQEHEPSSDPLRPPGRSRDPRRFERSFHRSLYLGAQLVRGRPIGRLMRRLQDWDSLDADAYSRLSAARLEQMLSFAATRVPLYRSTRWRTALEGRAGHIERWPVLERRLLVDERQALVPDGMTRVMLFPRRSSASTGTPVEVLWTLEAVAWSWAAEYHPMRWHKLDIGARTLRMWGSAHGFENFVLNRHFVPAHDLTPQRLEAATQYLETRSPELVWGTPSAVHELARHIGRTRKAQKPLRVPYIKVGGEQLYAFQREDVTRHLNGHVIESYGSTEMGPIAAECPAGSMHVLTANVHLEIFRDGSTARPGEHGEVVATTLVNRGMPLVRCRIGDLASLSPEPCSCGRPQPVLTGLQGRSADLVLKTDGTPIHGSALARALQRFANDPPLGAVQKIRFEQRDRQSWNVKVESHHAADLETLERQIIDLMRDVLGADCRVEIEIVDKIEREPSGKYRYYRTVPGPRSVRPHDTH